MTFGLMKSGLFYEVGRKALERLRDFNLPSLEKSMTAFLAMKILFGSCVGADAALKSSLSCFVIIFLLF